MRQISTEELQAMQASLGMAARLVQLEPDQAWVETCISSRMFEAAPFGEEDAAFKEGLSLMNGWVIQAEGRASEATGDIKREWLRLFIGCGTPEASILESYYVQPDSAMFAKNTIEVRQTFKRWGLEFERKHSEPDDSLGVMLAFCAELLRIQVDARMSGDEDLEERASREFEGFLVGHLLPWVSAWRFLVKQHAKTDYFRGVGELVFGLERECARRLGISYKQEDGSFVYKK